MSDLDDLNRIQQDTQNMLDDMAPYVGIIYALGGAMVVGLLLWLGHLFF